MSSIVHATIVEKPSKNLDRWIVAVVFVHTMYAIFCSVATRRTDDLGWGTVVVTWLIFGIIVPILGLAAARSMNKARLAVFGGVQAFVAVLHTVNFLTFTSVFVQVAMWCQSAECTQGFKSGNRSCYVVMANETYDMGIEYCEHLDVDLMMSIFYALLACVSFGTAIGAQRQKNVTLADIVTVRRVSCDVPLPVDIQVDETE